MTMTFAEKYCIRIEAAIEPLGDIAHVTPLHPDLERNLHRTPFNQNRPPKKGRLDKPPHKPQDPEHKVDDYA